MRLRQTPVAQKHRAISRPKKIAFSTPHRVALGLPSPLSQMSVRAGERTLTSQPKFPGSSRYQICLAM